MSNIIRLALALAVCLFSVAAVQKQSPVVPRGRLNSQIPRANRKQYLSIRDIQGWRNPILVIRVDGIEVIAKSMGRTTVAGADLQAMLINLPVNDWPYGRVVVLSEIGNRRPDGADKEPIRQNSQAAESVLKNLKIAINWVPSA
jgi:hypothetical protein